MPGSQHASPWIYRSCGVTLSSDRPLPGVRPAPAGSEPDVRLRSGERRRIPKEVPDGRLILDPSEQHRGFYTAVEDADGILLRFFAGCDIRIAGDLSSAVHHRAPDADDGLIDVLLAGTLLSLLTALRGACVLHASAVELDGRGLAFVGHSGMGKSTLAVASCAAGARLIAEDIVAVSTPEASPHCLPGNTDIRLRKGSVSLLERMAGAERVVTPDGREGVRPPLSDDEPVPLHTLVIPRPSRKAPHLTVDCMPPVSALFRLMNFPRLNGLIEPRVVQRQFQATGDIARRVPVLVVTVPWGPPFQDGLGERLLALLDRGAPGS